MWVQHTYLKLLCQVEPYFTVPTARAMGTPGIEPRPHVLQTYVPTSLHHVPTQCNLCTIDSYPTHVKSVGVLLVFPKSGIKDLNL